MKEKTEKKWRINIRGQRQPAQDEWNTSFQAPKDQTNSSLQTFQKSFVFLQDLSSSFLKHQELVEINKRERRGKKTRGA